MAPGVNGAGAVLGAPEAPPARFPLPFNARRGQRTLSAAPVLETLEGKKPRINIADSPQAVCSRWKSSTVLHATSLAAGGAALLR